MARFKQEFVETEDGFSHWIQPLLRGYKIACCDCGLVHDIEINVLRVVSGDPDAEYEAEDCDPKGFRVEFRVRRNNRSTAQIRRQDKKRRLKIT